MGIKFNFWYKNINKLPEEEYEKIRECILSKKAEINKDGCATLLFLPLDDGNFTKNLYVFPYYKEEPIIVHQSDKGELYQIDEAFYNVLCATYRDIENKEIKEKTSVLLATIIIKGEKYKIYKTSDDDYFVEVNEETLIDDDLDNLIEVLRKKVESSKKETEDAEFNETLEILNSGAVRSDFIKLKCSEREFYRVANIAFSNHNETVYFYKDYYIMGSYKPAIHKDFKECVNLYKNRGAK